jgi:hypothetical protein
MGNGEMGNGEMGNDEMGDGGMGDGGWWLGVDAKKKKKKVQSLQTRSTPTYPFKHTRFAAQIAVRADVPIDRSGTSR